MSETVLIKPPITKDLDIDNGIHSVNDDKHNGEDTSCIEKNVSKRQMKREIRKQKWLEQRPDKRKKERERRKVKRAEKKAAGIALPIPKKVTNMNSPNASKVSVVIDLSFHHLMSEKDQRKTIKQICRCYASNRHSEHPVQLHITSVDGDCKASLLKGAPAYPQWDMNVDSKDYNEVLTDKKIVYLSSDSENILEDLKDDTAYVIGGLVDHNAHKGLCHQLAVAKNVCHAQLPISEFVKMSSRKVLTINHVFEILLYRVNGKSWSEAFHAVIPKRKGAVDKPLSSKKCETSEEEEEDKIE